MARKREPLDPKAGQRLLQNKLKLLQGLGPRRGNAALDILTGRTSTPVAEPEDAATIEAQVEQRGNGDLPTHAGDPIASAAAAVPAPTPAAPESVPPADGQMAPAHGPAPAPAERRPPRPADRRTMVARTVYLSAEDLEDIEFVVRAWRRRLHRRVSRSEVLRQAIGNLRDAVELGAAPRNTGASAHREEADHQHA